MQQASQQIDSRASRRIRIAPGHVLLVASLLEIVGMLHHPSVPMSDASRAIEEIAQYATLSAIVHGALLTLMLAIAYGFIDFAVRRGVNRPLIRAGALAYGCGVLVMMGAGMVSGFIITRLAALLPHTTPVDLQISFQMMILCSVLNQACANVAVVAMSAGIISWSLDLCTGAGLQRWVGLLGCLAGGIPAIALIFGAIHLDVHGMTEVVAVQAAWNVALALLMLRDGAGHASIRATTLE